MSQDDDEQAIIGAILSQALCVSCIAQKTEVPASTIVKYLDAVQKAATLTVQRRCDGCNAADKSYRV